MSVQHIGGSQLPTGIGPGFKPARARRGTTAFLAPTTPLDLESAENFSAQARSARGRSRCLIVDLSQVDYVDSTGVRALMRLRNEMDAEGKELRLVIQPNSRAERTLKLLRLLDHFQTFKTHAEAWSGSPATD